MVVSPEVQLPEFISNAVQAVPGCCGPHDSQLGSGGAKSGQTGRGLTRRNLSFHTASDSLTLPLRPAPLVDADLARLEFLLDQLPEPLEPLDISALDGYLCGVLVQPQAVPAARWMPVVCDVEGRAAPPGPEQDELEGLVRRRHAELDAAIAQRQWFDPWIYPLDDEAPVSESMLLWVAGFAAAMERFPAVMASEDPELIEPLALLFMHFDPADLEDADALLAVIDTLEPPADLSEAVQDTVRALMLMADVTRPRLAAPARRPLRRQGGSPGPRKGRPR
jgi:uncharacterized protein